MLNAYIYNGVRTPFGRNAGALSKVRPDDMMGAVIRKVVDHSAFDAADIDDGVASGICFAEKARARGEIDGMGRAGLAGPDEGASAARATGPRGTRAGARPGARHDRPLHKGLLAVEVGHVQAKKHVFGSQNLKL